MPPIPINAGGMDVSRAKNNMTSDASLNPMPMPSVASMPVGILLLGLSFGLRGQFIGSTGALREQAQETGEEDGKEVTVLGRRPLLDGHWFDAVLLNTGVEHFLVPFRVLFRVDLVYIAALHRQQRK